MVIYCSELSHKLWKKVLRGERITPKEQKKFDLLERWISKAFEQEIDEEVAITEFDLENINNK